MAILKRVGLGRALTHPEMDENFSSVYFSSSLENNANNLRLYYDTNPLSYNEIPLNAGGSIGIINYANNRLVTATASPSIVEGEPNFTFDGSIAKIAGRVEIVDSQKNTLIGTDSGLGFFTSYRYNTTLGYKAGSTAKGEENVLIGYESTVNGVTVNSTTAIGSSALLALGSGEKNVAIGRAAGSNLQSGKGNIYIGNQAGTSTAISEDDKLYINNTSGTPLIGGNFSTKVVTVTGALVVSQNVNATSFTGSFQGDGSGLTGIPSTGWDGIRNGNAQITGSLRVSGSIGTIVDFTGVSAISGSVFSGSFVGNGSGLTGVTADWNGRRNGNAEITGSFIVSGSSPTINLRGVTTIDRYIKIFSPYISSIGIGSGAFGSSDGINNQTSVALGYSAAASALGNSIVAIGAGAGTSAGTDTVYVGVSAGNLQSGQSNVAVGSRAASVNAGNGTSNTSVGFSAAYVIKNGGSNTSIGAGSAYSLDDGNENVAVGASSLYTLRNGYNNVAIGTKAGQFARGASLGNLYLGNGAGPAVSTVETNKLYINNTLGNPLIGGDFSNKTVTISGSLFASQSVVAQSFTGSFKGSGADLTNLPTTTWNGIRNGNAQITGSLVVSGSGAIVNLTGTSAISGSTFSGSFVGNGSGLTGITATGWNGIRNGNAEITGSLIVSGALTVTKTITISSGSVTSYPGVNIIHLATSSLSAASTRLFIFPLDASTGYTGFKADYTLTDSSETSKKVGTLLGSWDRTGNSVINDSYTLATGNVTATAFSIASNNTSASLSLGVTAGTFELNMLVTAFKRSI